MQTLDYAQHQSRPAPWMQAALLSAPLLAGGAAVLCVAKWVHDEPFGIFRPGDVIAFSCYAALAIGSGGAWFMVARRRRLHWLLVLPVLAWLTFCAFITTERLFRYFGEPLT